MYDMQKYLSFQLESFKGKNYKQTPGAIRASFVGLQPVQSHRSCPYLNALLLSPQRFLMIF
jgi:hypothetical protein